MARVLKIRCGVTRKLGFRTHEAALTRGGEILTEGSRDADSLRAYKCGYCGYWHLTKK